MRQTQGNTLPLFPLNTVLFPGTPISLHIFEERYKLMMADILRERQPFGVVLIRDGMEAHGPLASPFTTGCTARIVHVEHLPDGRMNLVAVGKDRFQIIKSYNRQPYLTGDIELMPFAPFQTDDFLTKANALHIRVKKYLELLARLAPTNPNETKVELEIGQLALPEDPLLAAFTAASLLQISPLDKQHLLEIAAADEVLGSVLRIYRREIGIFTRIEENENGASSRSSWLN